MTPTRQNQVDAFFRNAKIGAAAWSVSLSMYVVLILTGDGQGSAWIWLNYIAFLVSFIAMIGQYRARMADEFTQEAWNAASNAAFIATVAWMLLATQIETLIAWAVTLSTGEPFATQFSYWWAFQMPLTSFYAVFWFRHWRA